ncbi:MAG: 5'-methylthioadenosine/S-adenosylhomocysteine nucleosidase [candidate division Zixibacteria bacterium]|nr:5'-methylthioadenosine/S-adenosylhomocysteine nucleosidase [candidate division Zixibacteria bacterium]
MTQIPRILTALALILMISCVREAPKTKSQTAQSSPAESVVASPPAAAQEVEASSERPWAILYAFPPEGEQLRKAALVKKDTVWAGRSIVFGSLVQPVVIASSGIGMTNAAATTQHIIDTYHPKAIIFTGICGGVNPQHQIGDIVIPEQWLTHDYGFWGKNGFKTDSIDVGQPGTGEHRHMMDIVVDTQLTRKLAEAGNAIAFRFRTVAGRLPEIYVGGLGVSGNTFIDSKPKREQLFHELQAEIVDMESAAVVQTAHSAGIPVAVVRSCSDLAGGSGSETASRQLEDFFQVTAYNSALVVQQFLEMQQTNK